MRLGRCTLTDSDIWQWRQSGDTVSFRSELVCASVDEMQARIQQLRGMVDNDDEDVFPFTWSEDATMDGFYRDFKITVEDSAAMLTTGQGVPFTVTMTRVAGFTAPVFENTYMVMVQTNALGLPATASKHRVGVPSTNLVDLSDAYTVGTATTVATLGSVIGTITADDGAVRFSLGVATPTTARYSWATTPGSFYVGSARVEQSYGGTYYPMVGQQVLSPASAWRVSNGIVRVTVTDSQIEVAHYDGSGWDTAKGFRIRVSSGVITPEVKAVRVLRNTSQHAVVRVVVRPANTNYMSGTIDISVRRGCSFASFVWSNLTTATAWVLEAGTGEAGTAITGGLKANAADASGNKYVMASPQATSVSAASGTLTMTTTQYRFMLGSEVTGNSVAAADQVDHYINATHEDQRVVAR